MAKENIEDLHQQDEEIDVTQPESAQAAADNDAAEAEGVAGTEDAVEADEPELSVEEKLSAELAAQKHAYLLLMAEFDNYRKRTLKEKQDLIKTAASRAMADLLPVIDDVERAIQAMESATDVDALREGVTLIHDKFVKYLAQQGVTPIESTGADFDPELHEAITMFPAASDDQRGKVVDTTTRGYMIHDKVLRHAKVVVGQ